MSDDPHVFERFLALAKRELAAEDVQLLGPAEPVPSADNVVLTRLADGRHVVATFAAPPKDGEVLERRLAMLAGTFAESLAALPSERMRARPPVATSLHEELKALAIRARARDAVVVDADSPVVWGSAAVPARPRARNDLLIRDVSQRELVSQPDGESGPLQDVVAPDESSPTAVKTAELDGASRLELPAGADDEEAESDPDVTRRAVAALRRNPDLAQIHKGRHLRHVQRDGEYFLAMSFAGIYVLCIVFEGPFDELRAERAAQDSLPRVERLVEALPPLDPEPQPMGGVVSLRRARRR